MKRVIYIGQIDQRGCSKDHDVVIEWDDYPVYSTRNLVCQECGRVVAWETIPVTELLRDFYYRADRQATK